jgi:hypothetical protein
MVNEQGMFRKLIMLRIAGDWQHNNFERRRVAVGNSLFFVLARCGIFDFLKMPQRANTLAAPGTFLQVAVVVPWRVSQDFITQISFNTQTESTHIKPGCKVSRTPTTPYVQRWSFIGRLAESY